jgi:DNA adenine methylase
MKPFLRTPGGKSKIAKKIVSAMLASGAITDYREPFLGGGSVCLELMEHIEPGSTICINDFDDALMCMWRLVVHDPGQLIDAIKGYVPKVSDFYDFKELLVDSCVHDSSVLETAMMRLIVPQISYSGLGVMAGGPQGGYSQNSCCPINARWNPSKIIQKIQNAHDWFNEFQVKCMSADYTSVIKNVSRDTVLYIDPPYIVQGKKLYQHSFSQAQHIRLAETLKRLNCRWFLSYDDCAEIRQMYSWAIITEIPISYTMRNKTGKKLDLLIQPRQCM